MKKVKSQDQVQSPSRNKGCCFDAPLFSCTTADVEIKYFFNKVTVGVLVNTGPIFYD